MHNVLQRSLVRELSFGTEFADEDSYSHAVSLQSILIQILPGLTALVHPLFYSPNTDSDFDFAESVVKWNTQLRHLRFFYEDSPDRAGTSWSLCTIFKSGLLHLRSLTLSRVEPDDPGVLLDNTDLLNQAQSSSNQVIQLHLRGSIITPEHHFAATLQQLGSGGLLHLKITDSPHVYRGLITIISQNCPQLQTLITLSKNGYNGGVSSVAGLAVAASVKKMLNLRCLAIDDGSFPETILPHLPRSIEVLLYDNGWMDASDFNDILKGWLSAGSIPQTIALRINRWGRKRANDWH